MPEVRTSVNREGEDGSIFSCPMGEREMQGTETYGWRQGNYLGVHITAQPSVSRHTRPSGGVRRCLDQHADIVVDVCVCVCVISWVFEIVKKVVPFPHTACPCVAPGRIMFSYQVREIRREFLPL